MLERINGFSVNMTVSLDLHRYEDEVSDEKLHDDSSLLTLTTRTLIAFRQFLQGGQPRVVFASLPYLMKNYLIRRFLHNS